MYKISTSILSSNNLTNTIEKLNKSITDYIHLDIMDGLFVPNTKFSIEELKNILPLINKPIDIHLMVENPLPYIKAINNPNVNNITIHIEINQDINSLIDTIKSSGYKACLAIKPNTNIEEIIPYIEKIDMVLIMSVEPGYGGQKFIPNSVEKLKAIKKINKNILTEVDGGINNDTITYVKDYTDIVVSGSYIINNSNYNEAIINLKK